MQTDAGPEPTPAGDAARSTTDGSAPTPQEAPTPQAAQAAIRRARGAVSRYRFMALMTGVMLLILCVEMALKYIVHADELVRLLSWVPFAHGWIYVVYLVTVFDLWSTMRWGWGRLVTMVIAGVVPVMSFLLERRIHADADAKLASLAQRYA